MGCTGSSQKNNNASPKKNISEQEKLRLEKQVTSKENIHRIYEFGQLLGSGGFGTVKVAIPRNKVDSHKKYAIKIIPIAKVQKKMHLLLRELEILKTLDHPNIIKFHEIYEDQQQFYIVQEYCGGGELLKRITSKKYKWTEKDVAEIFQKIISAVGHMHAKGIVHRDIKPENVLFSTADQHSDIKLIDFGLSNKFQKRERLNTMVGTPLYVSPQVLQGKYSERCDEWSLGVLLYILLVGYPPFYSDTKDGIFRQIEQGKFEMKGKEWDVISYEAKDLVRQFLQVNEKQRITVQAASKHKFFDILQKSQDQDEEKHLTQNVMNMLASYKTKNRFHNEVMTLIINRMNEKEIEELTKQFQKLDKDNTGLLTPAEIKEAMLNSETFKLDKENKEHAQQQLKQLDEQIEHIFDELANWEHDPDHPSQQQDKSKRTIQYTQFIASTLDYHKHVTEQRLYAIFKYCDSTGHDYISVEDLQNVFERHGRSIPIEQIKKMVEEVNPQHQNKISWSEFKKIMEQGQIKDNMKVAHH